MSGAAAAFAAQIRKYVSDNQDSLLKEARKNGAHVDLNALSEECASVFEESMRNGLPDSIKDGITVSVKVSNIDEENATFNLELSFDNISRPSLNGKDTLDDIVALLNGGYSTSRPTPRGLWHGKSTKGLSSRRGAMFLGPSLSQSISAIKGVSESIKSASILGGSWNTNAHGDIAYNVWNSSSSGLKGKAYNSDYSPRAKKKM